MAAEASGFKVFLRLCGVWRGGRARLNAHDSKSCRGNTLVGSNPTLSVLSQSLWVLCCLKSVGVRDLLNTWLSTSPRKIRFFRKCVGGIFRCPSLTHKFVPFRQRRRDRRKVVDSLCLVVEAISQGLGKSLLGRMRFLPKRKSPVMDVRIGVHGKGVGKWSLKEARDEWNLLRVWIKEHNKDPRDRKKISQKLMFQPWEDLFGQQ